MPTITLNKAELFERLGGKQYTTDEFDEMCFEFGVELDEDTTDQVMKARKEGGVGAAAVEEPALKIEIPANRYDLLCMEGLARGFRMFLGLEKPPAYRLSTPAVIREVQVEAPTQSIRPFFASAILHMSKPFTPSAYASFIDLQDKLHQNLCRGRRLVAIGTHDLDRIAPEGVIRYTAKSPKEIKFAPLNKDQEYTAEELMTVYESDRHLSRYLPIIRDAPEYPIIYDSVGQVLSMPPIINSQHTKITLDTRNIFVDVTATDKTKLDIVVNMVVTMFSEYCGIPFEVEPVRIIYPDGTSHLSPDLAPRPMTASVAYINAALGLSLEPSEMCSRLQQMGIAATPSATDADQLDVLVPPTRPDVLHECDLMEDVGIAYGYNRLPRGLPVTNTVARPSPVNKLGDVLRRECAQAGWTECLPLILCSADENYRWLRRQEDGTAVRLLNPASQEFQVVRTTLLPGLLKTLRENKALPLPMRVFECADIALVAPDEERRAKNKRRLAAAYSDRKGGFEVVHGLLDRIMQVLEVPRLAEGEKSRGGTGYYIKESDEPTFFPGRAATVHYRATAAADKSSKQEQDVAAVPQQKESKASSALDTVASALKSVLPHHHHHESQSPEATTTTTSASISSSSPLSGDICIGSLGILHPEVLDHFSLVNPVSALEIDVEPFL